MTSRRALGGLAGLTLADAGDRRRPRRGLAAPVAATAGRRRRPRPVRPADDLPPPTARLARAAPAPRGRVDRRLGQARPAHRARPAGGGRRLRAAARPAARRGAHLPRVGRPVAGPGRAATTPSAAGSLLLSWAGTDTREIQAGRPRRPHPRARAGPARLGRAGPARVALGDGPAEPAGRDLEPGGLRRRLEARPGDLRRRGCVRNAGWVWCPLAVGFVDGPRAAVLPGDDQVDWLCADTYPGRGSGRSRRRSARSSTGPPPAPSRSSSASSA